MHCTGHTGTWGWRGERVWGQKPVWPWDYLGTARPPPHRMWLLLSGRAACSGGSTSPPMHASGFCESSWEGEGLAGPAPQDGRMASSEAHCRPLSKFRIGKDEFFPGSRQRRLGRARPPVLLKLVFHSAYEHTGSDLRQGRQVLVGIHGAMPRCTWDPEHSADP